MTEIKKRYWAIIGYPESMPSNWLDILNDTFLKICISPLHDKDINPSTNEIKKPHHHILLCFENTTTFNNVKKISDKLNAPIPQYIESVRGAVRYWTHKDNPEKYQYSENDLIFLNGFNILDYSELTKSEVLKIKRDVYEFVRENKITEYCDLIDMLDKLDLIDMLDVVSSNTLLFNAYVTSIREKVKNNEKDFLTIADKFVCSSISGNSDELQIYLKELMEIYNKFSKVTYKA